YTYLSTRFTHDNELHLSLRTEPRGGAGYRFIKSKTRNLSADVGVAWIYENYFGDEFVTFGDDRPRRSKEFWTIAFGAQADAVLPYGALWRARGHFAGFSIFAPSIDQNPRSALILCSSSIV